MPVSQLCYITVNRSTKYLLFLIPINMKHLTWSIFLNTCNSFIHIHSIKIKYVSTYFRVKLIKLKIQKQKANRPPSKERSKSTFMNWKTERTTIHYFLQANCKCLQWEAVIFFAADSLVYTLKLFGENVCKLNYNHAI